MIFEELGQQLRSHEAEVRFGRLAEASLVGNYTIASILILLTLKQEKAGGRCNTEQQKSIDISSCTFLDMIKVFVKSKLIIDIAVHENEFILCS